MEKFEQALEHLIDSIISRVPSIILGILVLLVGVWLIRLLLKIVQRRFVRRNVDLSLRDFLMSVIRISLYILLFLTVASTVGIKTTSFIAVMGAASLSIGLALQGSLSNFAGGMLILLFKPFRVGDYVSTTNSAEGVVEKIDILYTTLRTSDGISVFAPNGPLANTVITNYSSITRRRIVYRIHVESKADIKRVRKLICDILSADHRILNTPKPEVRIDELTEDYINFVVRAWTPKEMYWDAYYENFEHIKETLEAQDIRLGKSTK